MEFSFVGKIHWHYNGLSGYLVLFVYKSNFSLYMCSLVRLGLYRGCSSRFSYSEWGSGFRPLMQILHETCLGCHSEPISVVL